MYLRTLKKFCSSQIISNKNKIKVLGYPFAGGQRRDGVQDTPTWLFEQKWFKELQEQKIKGELIKLEMKEPINIQQEKLDSGEALNLENVIKSSMKLKEAVDNSLSEQNFTIVIGGDHSQAIGSIQGVKSLYQDCKVIWIDAHIDCNTPNTSPSGNIHGMPLAFLSGFVEGYQHCMGIKDVCYMGIRSYEQDEKMLIDQNEILVFPVQDCSQENIHNIIHKIKQKYSITNSNAHQQQLWISFDIDAICSNEFESTGTAEANGISMEFINKFFLQILKENVIGIDISEINFSKTNDSRIVKRDQKSFQNLLINIIETIIMKNNQNKQ